MQQLNLEFEPVRWPTDASAVIDFLVGSAWPFHGVARLTREHAAAIEVSGDDVAAFWVRSGDDTVGLLRAFDLADIDDGSPLLDIRIAEGHRGRGIGTASVRWLTSHLFDSYPGLRRIEATTRHDNHAMRAVFTACGYRLEGRLVEAWGSADGTRFDTLIVAILRREWAAS